MAWAASQSQIEARLRHDPGVLEGCYRVAVAVADEARVLAPRGEGGARFKYGRGPSGVMAAAIRADHTADGARARSPVEWSAFNERGTGERGGNPTIRAKPKRPFVFYARAKTGAGAGTIQKFVLKTHKGMEANPFMSKAAAAVAASSDRLTWRPHLGAWPVSGP